LLEYCEIAKDKLEDRQLMLLQKQAKYKVTP
jgi:hypothetical protein